MYKLIVFDIDGVLTDGRVIVDEKGKEYKSYNLTEIDALNDIKHAGYKIAAITGEATTITNVFQNKILWDDFVIGIKDKVLALKQLEIKFNVTSDEICYIGDGKYDVEAIKYVGLGVCPQNAILTVKSVADVVLNGKGGYDCINELFDLLKNIQGDFLMDNHNALSKFKINDKTVIITGGAGLMGINHAEAVLSGGGIPILLDISKDALKNAQNILKNKFCKNDILIYNTDITDKNAVVEVKNDVLKNYGSIYALINNAANNPKMETKAQNMGAITFENFPDTIWQKDIAVGLTGALICSQVFGAAMAEKQSGVILNISSDLGIIAPDQRIYKKDGLKDEDQTVKPVTYSVIKHALIGLTKYIATYWAQKGVRCNALCPAGIENGQDEDFIRKLTHLVPMGRMAKKDEYQSTVLYMISDASAYMTGATVIVDGGRTCW